MGIHPGRNVSPSDSNYMEHTHKLCTKKQSTHAFEGLMAFSNTDRIASNCENGMMNTFRTVMISVLNVHFYNLKPLIIRSTSL